MASLGATMIWIIPIVVLLQNAAGLTTSPPLTDALYPYGPQAGDQMLQSDANLPIYMGYNINFYGRTYNTSYVTKNGFVAFDEHARYEHFIFKNGARDPDKDFPFVAPFHYDGEQITSQYQGQIYYRLVFANTSQAFLTQLQYYMLNSTPGVEHFVPDVALVVTWLNVTDKGQVDDGPCDGTVGNPCKSSTFQLVLVACPMNTFVIFNYRKMEIPTKTYYQAGINGGHGVGWTRVCKSCSIANLPNERGSDVKGRFIFRVSTDTIERGGCTDNGRDLQVSPDIAGMFGGELLDISGPCLRTGVSVTCRFGTAPNAVDSQGFRVNTMRLKCPVPKLTQRGFVPISISLDGGNTFNRAQGNIFIAMEGKVNKSLTLGEGWHKTVPGTLDMTWDPMALSADPDAKVDILLYGYRETEVNTQWKVLTTFATGADNSGSYSFSADDFQCHPSECDVFEVGVVEVQLQRPFLTQASDRVAMKAGVLLGWYVNNAMVQKHGDSWPPAKCTEWYNQDKADKSWMDTLLHCPCNVGQALADFGRWQPDHACSMFSTSATNCYYHKGAKHCVRSFKPTTSGAGNQCCYGQDGLLIYAADTYQGSTPDRSHDWGSAPYNSPGKVPSLSHWIKDLVSFYYCCLWRDYNGCDYYMELRPTRNCAGYQPSQAGTTCPRNFPKPQSLTRFHKMIAGYDDRNYHYCNGLRLSQYGDRFGNGSFRRTSPECRLISTIAYGDPHIKTFDGQLYNFGGKGDFYLLKSDQFQLQGKFEVGPQSHVDNRFYNATVLTSVAMKGFSDTEVEIRLAPLGLNSGRRLDVFVNKNIQIFDSPAVYKQDFTGVSVVNIVSDPNRNLHDNFTVIFQSGIGIQVAASNSLLNVIVNLPPTHKNKTSLLGLLGNWNGVASDDFTALNGNIIPVTSSPEDVYKNFAKTWNVAPVNTLFKQPEVADDSFVPEYRVPPIPQGAGFSLTDVTYTCGDDAQCKFDYIVTGSKDIAAASKKAGSWFNELKSFQQPAEACGLLDVPYAEKDSFNYTIDNIITLTGCRNGGSLSGDLTYTCTKNSFGELAWSPAVSAECSEASEEANVGMIVGIVLGVVAAVIIIIVIAVFSYRRSRSGDRKSSKKGEPANEEGQKDAMMSELEKKQTEEDDRENNA